MEFVELTTAVFVGVTAATVVGNFLFGAFVMKTAKRAQKKRIEGLAAQLKRFTKEGVADDK